MSYRIYDPSVLDQPAEFALTLDISSAYPKNPDGTAPVLTVNVKGGTNKAALTLLSKMAENDGFSILEVLLEMAAIEGNFAEELSFDDLLKDAKFKEVFNDTSKGFFSVPIDAKLEDSEGNEIEVSLDINAPSYAIAYKGFQALTTKDKLQGVLTVMMPREEDEDGYDDGY